MDRRLPAGNSLRLVLRGQQLTQPGRLEAAIHLIWTGGGKTKEPRIAPGLFLVWLSPYTTGSFFGGVGVLGFGSEM